MKEIYQGESKKIYITMRDTEGAINLSLVDEVILIVVDSKNTPVLKYSTEVRSGYDLASIENDTVLLVNIEGVDTAKLAKGLYRCEILIKKTELGFESSFKTAGVVELFKVLPLSSEATKV